MKKLLKIPLLTFISIIILSCNDKDTKSKAHLKAYDKTNTLNLLTKSEWILASEKSILGVNDVPSNYHMSKIFNKNNKGFEMISSNLNKRYPKKESFEYSLEKDKLIIIQNDGYILTEEIRYIDSAKLVTYIEKFDNERTYVPIKSTPPILIEKITNDTMFCEILQTILFELKSNPYKYTYPVNVLDNIYGIDQIQRYLKQTFYNGNPKYYQLITKQEKAFIWKALNFSDSNNIIFDGHLDGNPAIVCNLLDKSIYQAELQFIFKYALASDRVKQRMKSNYSIIINRLKNESAKKTIQN